ncbi:MAG: condensation domain-containing protein, partial [Verrucomicrobiota bacterium]
EDLMTFGKLASYLDGKTKAVAPAAPAKDEARTMTPPSEKTLPLSEAQREMWFASQMSEGASLAYNESMTLKLSGKLDLEALRRALRALVARHEALRTRIGATGETQRILASDEVTLQIESSQSGESAEAWLERHLRQPFTLAEGALFRPVLLQVSGEESLFALIVHHSICDGWSLGLMARELGELYAAETTGKPAQLAAAPSLSAYLEKQAASRDAKEQTAAREYWKKEFTDGAPLLDLPTDRPRKNERDYAGALAIRTLPAQTVADLKALCAKYEYTTFTALLAAYSLLVHRLSGQDDIVIGVPSAAQVLGGESALVGHFANLLAIRSNVAENPAFQDYLAQIGRKLTDAVEHCSLPFGELLRHLNLPRDPSRAPLAPVVFNTTGRHPKLPFGNLQAEAQPAPKTHVNFDLNLNFGVSGDIVMLGCYYSTELFDRATVERWLDHLQTLLRGIAAAPATRVGELPLLTEGERQQILVEWNNTRMEYARDANIPELFEAQVKRTPEAIAVVGERERVSYAELDRRAERIAARLLAAGVKPDDKVGLFLGRSPQLLAGILGVLKAGAGYVPLDPNYPTDRLAYIVEDTKMQVLVTERAFAAGRPAGEMNVIVIDDGSPEPAAKAIAPRARPTAESLAYIIYTSGSTGKPKGVQITHRCVTALAAWAQQLYTKAELGGVFFATSASFDISIFEIFCPLCLGGKLIVAENILQLGTHPARNEVSFLSGVPSAMAEVVRTKIIPESVTTVALAGRWSMG